VLREFNQLVSWGFAMGWMEVSLVVRWSTNHSKPGVGDSITPSSVEFKIWPVYRGLSEVCIDFVGTCSANKVSPTSLSEVHRSYRLTLISLLTTIYLTAVLLRCLRPLRIRLPKPVRTMRKPRISASSAKCARDSEFSLWAERTLVKRPF